MIKSIDKNIISIGVIDDKVLILGSIKYFYRSLHNVISWISHLGIHEEKK